TLREKTMYVLGVALAATVLPLITGIETALVFNGAFHAAWVLVLYYLAAGSIRWVAGRRRSAVTAAALVLVAVTTLGLCAPAAHAQQKDTPYVVQIVEPGPPVEVPKDAIILPYDPDRPRGVPGAAGPGQADKLLLPYSEFVHLWNLAYPERKIETEVLPAPYALSGAAFRARLEGSDFLLIEGHVDIDVYTAKYASVPLPMDGGVLAKAELDGRPARLSVVTLGGQTRQTMQQNEQAQQQGPPKTIGGPTERSFIVLHVTGKGKHRLELSVRMKLERQGGWRLAAGRLPAAAATALTLEVPDARSELRLGGIADRQTYETSSPNQLVETALSVGGEVSLRWRPKVLEGETDKTLTCESDARFDIQEDWLRLEWSLSLTFRRGEREFFTVDLPDGYLVEKVTGTNVRGWEVKRSDGGQRLEVALLKKAKGEETFSVHLWLPRPPAAATFTDFDVPVVAVTGAIRHSGQVTIRRSSLLEVRTTGTRGVTRTDLPSAPKSFQPGVGDESPLTLKPYQAFKFVRTPFTVSLSAAPVSLKASAVVQTFLKVAQIERAMESRVIVTARDRKLYRVRVMVPGDLRIEHVLVDGVLAPDEYEWALTDEARGKVLTLYLNRGVEGTVPVLVRGTLGREEEIRSMDLPRLEVLDVEEQQGDVAVQVDPAYDVRADALRNIETVLPERVYGWLTAPQKPLMRLALHYKRPDYAGRLLLTERKPDVTCRTLTNVRVTDRALTETILLDFTIHKGGIREVAFLLPERMKDARFKVRLLRQKHVEAVKLGEENAVRVRLELQDALMDDLRVVVENDRLLTEGTHTVPIPTVETGRTLNRYAALELMSTVRDEVIIEPDDSFEELGRQQKAWDMVREALRRGITRAYTVKEDAIAPRLSFRTKERKLVETPDARIGLAHTVVVLDTNGAYRAQLVYTMNNAIEQFLHLALPEGATLWTARVDGKLVKPTCDPADTRPNQVRIPLVKTTEGDQDYEVVLKYGGKLSPLRGLRRVTAPLVQTVNIR
ncbi:MAG TPA: hypothetical protein VMZ92_17180, partial [Planctomycetota bacterium]|nr:hypothetical protein [Planctomycetota bacterium]